MRHTERTRVLLPEWVGEGDGVDAARLTRGLELHVERAGYGRFRVSGGDEPHWVDLADPGTPRCDCGDHLWRGVACKHLLAALLRAGDERVLTALADVVRTLREAVEERRRRGVSGGG
jgi:hypothetical protein